MAAYLLNTSHNLKTAHMPRRRLNDKGDYIDGIVKKFNDKGDYVDKVVKKLNNKGDYVDKVVKKLNDKGDYVDKVVKKLNDKGDYVDKVVKHLNNKGNIDVIVKYFDGKPKNSDKEGCRRHGGLDISFVNMS
jgi:hypothetical protein